QIDGLTIPLIAAPARRGAGRLAVRCRVEIDRQPARAGVAQRAESRPVAHAPSRIRAGSERVVEEVAGIRPAAFGRPVAEVVGAHRPRPFYDAANVQPERAPPV